MTPSGVGLHVRVDHVTVEVVAEVEHEVVDVELLRHTPGIVDIAHAAAPGVALAAPELHRHADDVVPLFEQQRAGAPTSRHHRSSPAGPSSAAPLPDRQSPEARHALGRRRRRRGRRRPRWCVWPSVIRSAPAGTTGVDAHRRQHVRGLHRTAGARRCGAGAHVGLVEQEQQRLALDAVEAHVRGAGDLAVTGHGLDACRRPRAAVRRRAGRGGRRCARLRRRARHRSRPRRRRGRRCRRRCACRSGARVPGHRRASAARADTPSRIVSTPTPLGPPNLWALSDIRSTSGATAAGRSTTVPARRRCAAAPAGHDDGRAPTRRPCR